MLTCPPIGVIEGEQRKEKRDTRNDRIMAVAVKVLMIEGSLGTRMVLREVRFSVK